MLNRNRILIVLACLSVAVVTSAHAASLPGRFPPELLPPAPPTVATDLKILVQERKKRFTPRVLHSPPGTVMITVRVPHSAKQMHGVGIDGGVYKNIEGAPVKPGRETSLTVDVKPGRYVIYDSYKHNRGKGFRSKLIVDAPTP